jgi:hypothetical protein
MKRRQLLKLLLTLTGGCAIGGLSISAIAAKKKKEKPGKNVSRSNVVNKQRRRRRRRRIHRNMRLRSLPYGCSVTRTRGGVTYYHCGGIWYRPAYHGTTVVYVVEDIDSGADTEVEFEE